MQVYRDLSGKFPEIGFFLNFDLAVSVAVSNFMLMLDDKVKTFQNATSMPGVLDYLITVQTELSYWF